MGSGELSRGAVSERRKLKHTGAILVLSATCQFVEWTIHSARQAEWEQAKLQATVASCAEVIELVVMRQWPGAPAFQMPKHVKAECFRMGGFRIQDVGVSGSLGLGSGPGSELVDC